MPRPQADDYDDKKNAILDAAAVLFARDGYPNTKLQDIARACGASKSMLYHYFGAKEDLLFALLSDHLQQMIAAIGQIDAGLPPQQRFAELIEVYARKSAQVRTRHIVAMNDVKHLGRAQQRRIVAMQRRIVAGIGTALRELDPGLPDDLDGAYAMLLVGMLNWTDLWYDPKGRIPPDELCARISTLFLHGFLRRDGAAPFTPRGPAGS